MKQIGRIFIRDIRSIANNWAASVLFLGLALLPSLYAWFNIASSWDPYAQTGGIRVAVVNRDQGAVLRGTPLNIGNEIVSSLRNNSSFGWRFVDGQQALRGVQRGEYYASIEIPANFSSRIATVLTDNPQKAELVYTVNEKISAVAPKMTAQGASAIVEQVRRNFVKTANETIFRIFNEIGIALQQNMPTILRLRDMVFRLESMIPEINRAVNVAERDAAEADGIVRKVQADLPVAARLAEEGEKFSGDLAQFLGRSAAALDAAEPAVKQQLMLLQQTATAAESLSAVLADPNADPAAVDAALDQAAQRLTPASDAAGGLLAWLDRLNGMTTGGSGLAPAIGSLKQVQSRFQQQLAVIGQIRQAVAQGAKPAGELIDGLNRAARDASAAAGDLLSRYDGDIRPRIAQAVTRAQQAASQAQSVLADANRSMPDVRRIVRDAAAGLTVGRQALAGLKRNLPAAEAKTRELADRIRQLEKEGNLSDLIHLLINNPSQESNFFAEPVVLKKNELYPIPNYGSAMSPFFTTLSLWVGALLLVSLIAVDVDEPGADYRSHQVYFGRFFTFLAAALLQSLFVTTGDIWILHAYVADKGWFVLFGLLLSAVFMLIVYTLVSVFGNVGKALAIVLLVLQLAGSGGTFPIEATPWFFQKIHPFLPFTYAIGLMREAVGGILWDIAVRDLLMMAVYAAAALVVGLALKKSINRASSGFVRKARASRLIH